MLSEYFNTDSIISLIKKATLLSGLDDKMVGGMNGILNILFDIGKMIVLSGNFLIKNIYSVDILNQFIDKAFNSGNQIWNSIFSTFGTFFVMLLFAYGLKDFMRYGLEKIFMRMLIFAGLFVVGTGFYSSGTKALKDINTISNNAQAELVAIMAPNISKPAEDLTGDLGLTEPEEVTGQVENMLYYKFVLEPFSLMNFGKTNISSKEYKNYTLVKGDKNSKKDDIEKLVGEQADKNAYFTGDKLGTKFLILLNASINYLIVAGVILLIAVMNFLVQIFILMMVLLSPIFLARALLPDNEQVMFNYGKLIFSSFALKIILGIGFGFVFMLLGWIDSAFSTTTIISVVASLVIKIILAYMIIKNYSWFKSVITQGRTSGIPNDNYKELLGKFKRSSYGKAPDNSTELPSDVKQEIDDSSLRAQHLNNDYADNVILQSALDESEIAPTSRLDNLAHKLGYMNERGITGTVRDSVSDMYQESKLGDTVDKIKSFNPKEKMETRFSEISSSFQNGQLEAFDKNGLVNNPEIPIEPMRMNETEQRIAQKGRENVIQENVSIKDFRRESHLSNATEDFEKRLAKLRGEPYVPTVNFEDVKEELEVDKISSKKTEENTNG